HKHLMIDIETLDTVETAVILSIAAVEFDPMCHGTKKVFYGSASIQRQLDMGRTISADTLKWWIKQDREVMKEAFSEITDYKFILHDLDLNLRENGLDKDTVIWANSPAFDLNKLKHAYRQMGVEWMY